jgi:hypothetical protein
VAIYRPSVTLSEGDREALVLLGQLALSTHSDQTNFGPNEVPLSPAEAERLLHLLEQFVSSRRFLEGAYFTEGMANGNGHSDERLKEIYLSWRTRTGRTRVASTYTWNEFVLRLGFNSSKNAWMWPRSGRFPVRPMALAHFVKMEKRLIDTVGLHPRVRNLIVEFVENRLVRLEEVREGNANIEVGSTLSFVRSFVRALGAAKSGLEKAPMSRRKIIAISTIVMDTASLFITRDWTACGVLSTLASVLPDTLDTTGSR